MLAITAHMILRIPPHAVFCFDVSHSHCMKLFPTKQVKELVGTLRKTITEALIIISVALKQGLADGRVVRHLLRDFSKKQQCLSTERNSEELEKAN